jgi:hypothetical protein
LTKPEPVTGLEVIVMETVGGVDTVTVGCVPFMVNAVPDPYDLSTHALVVHVYVPAVPGAVAEKVTETDCPRESL